MTPEIYELHMLVGRKAGFKKTCGNKVQYPDEEAARDAAFHVNKKRAARRKQSYYPCLFCGNWHIGGKMNVEGLRSYLKNG